MNRALLLSVVALNRTFRALLLSVVALEQNILQSDHPQIFHWTNSAHVVCAATRASISHGMLLAPHGIP